MSSRAPGVRLSSSALFLTRARLLIVRNMRNCSLRFHKMAVMINSVLKLSSATDGSVTDGLPRVVVICTVTS